MPHNIRLSDEVYDAYQDLADTVGLPSVNAAIAFTAKQALPALKARFTPSAELLQQRQNVPQSPQSVNASPQGAATCGISTPPTTESPQPVTQKPLSAGAKFLMED